MPRFDISTYDPVDSRLQLFWSEHPNGAVVTELVSDPNAADVTVFKAKVYFDVTDKEHATGGEFGIIPNGVGYAQGWKNGPGMADATSWLEVAETSAIGRALANCGYKAKIDSERPSQEEMSKAGAFDDNRPQRMANISQGYQRSSPAPAIDAVTFEERHPRGMKKDELLQLARKNDIAGENVYQVKKAVEAMYKVTIAGTAPDGGCLPADVANAISYYSATPSTDRLPISEASALFEADTVPF